MRDLMNDAGLPEPEFSEVDLDGYLVRVTLRSSLRDVSSPTRATSTSTADAKVEKIVAHLGKHPNINVTEAEQVLGVGWRTAKATLDAMTDSGHLERKSVTNRARDPKARYYLRPR